jgi:hypothetical protein
VDKVNLAKKDSVRQEKGKQIALKSDLIRLSDYLYHVHSQTTKRDYDVIKTNEKWSCSCPDYKFRHVCCKHIHAVEYSICFPFSCLRFMLIVTIHPYTHTTI